MAVENTINSVYQNYIYLELYAEFLSLTHILLTKSCIDTWPKVVPLIDCSSLRGKKHKSKLKTKHPEPNFKKLEMRGQKQLHLVAGEINWHRWSSGDKSIVSRRVKVNEFLLPRSARPLWWPLPEIWVVGISCISRRNLVSVSTITFFSPKPTSTHVCYIFILASFELCFHFLRHIFFACSRNRYHRPCTKNVGHCELMIGFPWTVRLPSIVSMGK